MRKWLKVVLVTLVIALTVIQFFPIQTNTGEFLDGADFIGINEPPDRIGKLIVSSCYDCHSNRTEYPWYSHVQPIGWLLQYHIDNGKSELNFSEYGHYSDRRKRMKLESSINQIEDGEMPLFSYTILHPEAKLSNADKRMLIDYLTNLKEDLE